ncbi:MAG: hypothetical protein KME17_21800 [Cyanosarcina radialis HA8281-LM2]|nr:hypothetical protein [Cyanosarcina radialis HA8281-LM2]
MFKFTLTLALLTEALDRSITPTNRSHTKSGSHAPHPDLTPSPSPARRGEPEAGQ